MKGVIDGLDAEKTLVVEVSKPCISSGYAETVELPDWYTNIAGVGSKVAKVFYPWSAVRGVHQR